MQIYNSLTGTKSEFTPITPGEVKIYVCGQTVYDYCHIGHARSMIVFDMVVRYFRAQNYKVTFVRNITDVDDKIIKRANENHESCDALVSRFIDIMHEDEKTLGLLPVNHEPRATQFIQPIIELIQVLLDKKAAYIASNGDVCFSVRQCADYGKLSKRNIDDLLSGARIEVGDSKNDPLDFVLWKLAKPNEPQWDSPWGAGRPGWHIECSAMASTLLGQPFDIHGGGMDLKFPHHENEIAQSECAYDTTFANVWMHAGLLNVNGEKMSKSLNNFFTIQDVLKKHLPEVVRYFMLSSHYRSPVNYSDENMQRAQQSLTRLYNALRNIDVSVKTGPLHQQFADAMNDDFNSPEALAVLFELAKEINILREQNKLSDAAIVAGELKHLGAILGILQLDPDVFLQGDSNDDFAKKVDQLIHDRNEARKNKNYAESDRIRDVLKAMNVVIEDSSSGTTWRRNASMSDSE